MPPIPGTRRGQRDDGLDATWNILSDLCEVDRIDQDVLDSGNPTYTLKCGADSTITS